MKMTRLLVAFVFILASLLSAHNVFSQADKGFVGVKACMTCHPVKGVKNEETLKIWGDHKHSNLDRGCEACHGPGAEHSALGPKQLLDLKKKKGDLKITVNRKSELCGECHKQTDDKSIALVSDVLVKGQQQYTEMLYNKKATLKMTCVMCHDAHASSNTDEGIKRKCLDCHKGKYMVEVKIAAMSDLSCEDCHMPYAGKNASDETKGGYTKGDVRSHIFGISADPKYKLNDGAGHAKLNSDGYARLTVEMTCYACHKTGKAPDMTREQLLKSAAKIH